MAALRGRLIGPLGDDLALAARRLEAKGHEFESRVVQLRFFGGLTIEEVAEHLEVGHATVGRAWRFARGWLFRELSKSSKD